MMTPGVVQIPGDVSVSEAASLLDREQMPCLLVKDGEAAFGIMTSGDIVKKSSPGSGTARCGSAVHHVETGPFRRCDQILDDATSVMASTGTSLLIVTKQRTTGRHPDCTRPGPGPETLRDLPSRHHSRDQRRRRRAKHTATIRQLSHVGASIESRTLLLPGTSIVLSFILPGTDLSFSLQGTILNSNYEPEFHEDRNVLGTYSGIDINSCPLVVRRIENSGLGVAKPAACLGSLLSSSR